MERGIGRDQMERTVKSWASWSCRVEPELLQEMRGQPEVDWSAVARRAFRAELAKRKGKR